MRIVIEIDDGKATVQTSGGSAGGGDAGAGASGDQSGAAGAQAAGATDFTDGGSAPAAAPEGAAGAPAQNTGTTGGYTAVFAGSADALSAGPPNLPTEGHQ